MFPDASTATAFAESSPVPPRTADDTTVAPSPTAATAPKATAAAKKRPRIGTDDRGLSQEPEVRRREVPDQGEHRRDVRRGEAEPGGERRRVLLDRRRRDPPAARVRVVGSRELQRRVDG